MSERIFPSRIAGERETPLRSTLAYLQREAARRAKGAHPGMMRLADDELAALVEVLRREVGPAPAGAPPLTGP